jgi:DNA-binding transcriptional LysR family regulator
MSGTPALTSGVVPFKHAQLHYFAVVAEEGQITRAAQKLHIAQPALSQAVAHLESELGFQLFTRHARGVTLTRAGEAFLAKARAVLAATEDALETAESLARTGQAALALGYVGLPPTVTSPDLINAFSRAHPDIDLRAHELPFPYLPTAAWLGPVDAAICTRPAADSKVAFQALSSEPRAVLAPIDHPLACKPALALSDVLEEAFLGFAPSVDPTWAGFWSLDDHRGGPPSRVIAEDVTNAQQRFAALAGGDGIATAPACHATAIASALPRTVAVPLTDAEPAVLTLVALKECLNPLVRALFATARRLDAQVDGNSRSPGGDRASTHK